MSLRIDVLASVGEVPAETWEALRRDDYPFFRHDFLLGLEQSDCTTPAAGWSPSHLCLRDGDRTLAILPAWRKSHSYGEYVFDWAWADAWRRMGLAYYPKLLTAAPFTPATGPRLLHAAELDRPALWATLAEQMPAVTQRLECSSWHVLFPETDDAASLAAAGLHTRHQVQFHWFNRGYRDFDDFLDRFASRKRKALRKERRRVAEQGIEVRLVDGTQLTERDWAAFHRFYQMTYAKRSGHGGYLTREFFLEVAPRMGEQVLMAIAEEGSRPVAGALYFRDRDTLYGRYWGCIREYDCLHFEACYYQGIDYCIREGLKRFDPGAQGEHKIQRGFEPTTTLSSHWIAEPELSAAIADFTVREKDHVERYRQEACTLLPFKAGEA
ncbi:MAG: GNAT family N-acetyltransferase [Halieaceae bacterium]|jgi:predicted N-acyltransferase|nr:GNAT family N-acetyltransferase [Halieaceae bacterium]